MNDAYKTQQNHTALPLTPAMLAAPLTNSFARVVAA